MSTRMTKSNSFVCDTLSDGKKYCYLCGKAEDKHNMTLVLSKRKDEWISFIIKHLTDPAPLIDILICKKHQLEAKRYHDHPQYVPKWKEQLVKPSMKCIYSSCNNTNLNGDNIIKATFAPKEYMEKVIGLQIDGEIMLCKGHYNKVYREIYPPTKCTSCNAYPKLGTTFTHHSPNGNAVSTYRISLI